MVKNKKKKNVQKIFQARLLDAQILPNPWYEEFFPNSLKVSKYITLLLILRFISTNFNI